MDILARRSVAARAGIAELEADDSRRRLATNLTRTATAVATAAHAGRTACMLTAAAGRGALSRCRCSRFASCSSGGAWRGRFPFAAFAGVARLAPLRTLLAVATAIDSGGGSKWRRGFGRCRMGGIGVAHDRKGKREGKQGRTDADSRAEEHRRSRASNNRREGARQNAHRNGTRQVPLASVVCSCVLCGLCFVPLLPPHSRHAARDLS